MLVTFLHNSKFFVDEKLGFFFLVSKEGVQQNALMQYWEENRVLHPGRLASLLRLRTLSRQRGSIGRWRDALRF